MAKKQAPVVVTITKQRRKDDEQPYTVDIDKPGAVKPYRLKPRYGRVDSAWRGALRSLQAVNINGQTVDTAPHQMRRASAYEMPDGKTWIEFRYIDRSKGAPKAPRKVSVTNDLMDTALHVHRSTKKK